MGLLATTGTVQAELYQHWLGEFGLEVVAPHSRIQNENVMPAIRAVKAGNQSAQVTTSLADATQHLVARGAQVVIAGCTEIPLGLSPDQAPCDLIDPAIVLAQALLDRVATSLHAAPPLH